MPEPTFTEGQRVYHRQLKWHGTYLCRDDLDRSTSHVEFDNGEGRRITTAQLMPAEEVDA